MNLNSDRKLLRKEAELTAQRRTLSESLLCESRGGRPGFPVPSKPYGFCGRKAPCTKKKGRPLPLSCAWSICVVCPSTCVDRAERRALLCRVRFPCTIIVATETYRTCPESVVAKRAKKEDSELDDKLCSICCGYFFCTRYSSAVCVCVCVCVCVVQIVLGY